MLSLVTGASQLPITIGDAKEQIRGLDKSASDNNYVFLLLSAVTNLVETFTGRAIMTQTWDWFRDDVPEEDVVEIPRPPLQSITDIKTVDQSDVSTIFAATNYFVDTASEPGRIALKTSVVWPTGLLWPTTTLKTVNGFVIRFVAGYTSAANVPETIRIAILRAVDALYSNRKTKSIGANGNAFQGVKLALPEDVKSLLIPYKVFKV